MQQIIWRRAGHYRAREATSGNQGVIAIWTRAFEAQESCGWDKTLSPSSLILKASCWTSPGKNQGVTHASSPGRDSLAVAGGYSGQWSDAGALLLASLGQGNVTTFCWRGRRLLKGRHRSTPGGYFWSWNLIEMKGCGFLKWEEKASKQCYRQLLKRTTNSSCVHGMSWTKQLVEKIHTLKLFLTRTIYLKYQKFIFAYQYVPWELNLK